MTQDSEWSVDQSHSEISFSIKHLMISNIKGKFKTFDASIHTTGKDFTTAAIDLWIDISSITTGDAKRDEHLKGTDFFNVEKHKEITFLSNTIGKPDANGNYELWGDLAMNGVTKNIKLNASLGGIVTDPYGKEKAGFTVTGTINRKDWDLAWNSVIESGGFVIGESVNISCDIELINEGDKELEMNLKTAESKK